VPVLTGSGYRESLRIGIRLRSVERGLLSQFAAVVVAKPKAWDHSNQTDEPTRQKYREDQCAAVLQAMGTYNDAALIVIGPDFGHTDP